tara:strand:- start:37 stop:480 length:444 start_codon:yes stop_codon:yes gene_type:complete
MSNWKSILKESRQITGTGIKTKLGTGPLTISDNGDDENECCEEAYQAFNNLLKRNFNLNSDVPSTHHWFYLPTKHWQRIIKELGVTDLQNPNIDWDEEKCGILEVIMEDAANDYFKGFGDGLQPQYEYYDTNEKIKSIFAEWDNCEG